MDKHDYDTLETLEFALECVIYHDGNYEALNAALLPFIRTHPDVKRLVELAGEAENRAALESYPGDDGLDARLRDAIAKLQQEPAGQGFYEHFDEASGAVRLTDKPAYFVESVEPVEPTP